MRMNRCRIFSAIVLALAFVFLAIGGYLIYIFVSVCSPEDSKLLWPGAKLHPENGLIDCIAASLENTAAFGFDLRRWTLVAGGSGVILGASALLTVFALWTGRTWARAALSVLLLASIGWILYFPAVFRPTVPAIASGVLVTLLILARKC
jgi:hypothetical protein